MTSTTIAVEAPNGRLYRFHTTRWKSMRRRGFVYAWGHRVYGDATDALFFHAGHPTLVPRFTPTGKWAFIVQPNLGFTPSTDKPIGGFTH